MGMVEQLMSLLHCEHAPYHEHVMRIIVNLAREHAPSLAECRRPELSFNEFLLQHVIDLRDKPEFQVRFVNELSNLAYMCDMRLLCDACIVYIDTAKLQTHFLHFFLAESHVSVPFSWPFFTRIELNLLCIFIE